MGYLRTHMENEMLLRGYSQTTIAMYTKYMQKFASYFGESPLTITQAEIRTFFLDLISKRASPTTLHIFYSALKLFYRLHGQPHYMDFMPHPKRPFVVPAVLDQSEIESILSLCRTLRYKTLFALIYSAGLRISEAVNLCVADIDIQRKMIHVRAAKNRKDRYAILSDKAIVLLNRYFNRYDPISYLFYSLRDRNRRLSIRHIQHTFQHLVKDASIAKKAHVHTLRHSFATHLLESNTNLFHIMQLLGHSCIKSTIIYLHMQRLDKLNISSPLDSCDISIDAVFNSDGIQPSLRIA